MLKFEGGSLVARRVAPQACQAATSGIPTALRPVLRASELCSGAVILTVQQVVAYCLFTGRSIKQLCVDIQRMLWRSVGWMSSSPRYHRALACARISLLVIIPRYSCRLKSACATHADTTMCSSGRPFCVNWGCVPRSLAGKLSQVRLMELPGAW